VGSLIALALTNFFAESQRLQASSQNEQAAQMIVQELIEYTRGVDYSFLNSMVGRSYSIPINKNSSGEVGPEVRTAPQLLMDSADLNWNILTEKGRFADTNSVSYSIISGPDMESITVEISVQWTDGRHYTEPKTSSVKIVRNEFGNEL
ncbi:MAG: hypothetical protein KC777_26505, partial [Cyanobacteria bacterium HKST-UBA02]|nr:hypothetical protein [Cyanobacteria bacterium HKST-UBA02]